MRTLDRRQFLRGASGLAVALPLMPSLLSREALAQTATARPRLVMMGQQHGGFSANMFGDLETRLPSRLMLYPGHEISFGPIPRTVANGKTVISNVLQASSGQLTERLVGKMNVLRGFDSTGAHGHNETGFGGGKPQTGAGWPSVDQIAAWSNGYNVPGTFRERSIALGAVDAAGAMNHGSPSLHHQSPLSASGNMVFTEQFNNPQAIFDRLFTNFTPGVSPPPPPVNTRRPLVDHVLEDYRRLKQSNRRLSAADRARLDSHMEMLSELQRRVNEAAQPPPPVAAGCSVPARPTDNVSPTAAAPRGPSASVAAHQLYNDLIVAAFKCGITRIATVWASPHTDYFMTTNPGTDYHNACHGYLATPAHQTFFEKVVVDLAAKLDVDEGGGKTFLDNTLLVYTNDQGYTTHCGTDRPFITFGGASGFFKTGLVVDYRNRMKTFAPLQNGTQLSPGLLFNQFWSNALDALGVPRTEWDRYAAGGAGRGYGPVSYTVPERASLAPTPSDYVTGVAERAGEKLAVIT